MLGLHWIARAGLVLGGCISAPPPPPVATPIGDEPEERRSILGIGVEMPRFDGRYEADGTAREVSPQPRLTVAALQILAAEKRFVLSPRCDLGVHLGVGRSGGDVRCGLGTETSAVAVGTGLSWIWLRGVEGETTVQAGTEDEGWLLYVSTGLGYSANYGWTVPLDEPAIVDLGDLLYRPSEDRLLVVQQLDLSWVATLAIGVPADRDFSMFMGLRLRYPFATTEASFQCVGCDGTEGTFGDFYPGWALGMVVGGRGAGF